MVTGRPGDAAGLAAHDDFCRAAPTPDHFIPLLYFAGLAAAAGRSPKVLVDGYAMGSLSMTSYTLDARCPTDRTDTRPAARVPDPAVVPAEDTNV